MIRIGVVPALLLALGAARVGAQQDSPEVRQLTDRADALGAQPVGVVGSLEWFTTRYCHPTETPATAEAERRLWRSMVIPPTPVFDNLNYVGHGQYGAWVLETSEGLILIDALDGPDEGRQYIEAGMAELGLDPADLGT